MTRRKFMRSFKGKKEVTNEEKILEYLKKETNSQEISENKILLDKYNLSVGFKIRKIQEYEDLIMTEIAFVINHDYFGEPIIEIIAGIEENIDGALNLCVKNISSSVLQVITNALDDNYDETFESNFFAEKRSNSLTKGSIQNIGELEDVREIDFWSMLGEKIKDRLGNKKLYLVRVYASKLKSGDSICECRINGIVNEDITNHIKNYAEGWKSKSNFSSLKQIFVIKQSNETYNKYPCTKEQIIEFSHKSIKILSECDSEEKYNNIDNEILKITKDASVAYEIRTFIPEIFCELFFDEAHYSNKIILVKNNEKIEGYKGQFTSYYWIYEWVVNIYNSRILSEQELKTIVSLSASYKAISESITKDRKMEEVKNILIGLCGPIGYVPS